MIKQIQFCLEQSSLHTLSGASEVNFTCLCTRKLLETGVKTSISTFFHGILGAKNAARLCYFAGFREHMIKNKLCFQKCFCAYVQKCFFKSNVILC